MDDKNANKPRVVIIGGGFGGLQLAKSLKNAPVEILMLDKHNYHTFQPLLYQVATGAIQADSIAFPIRRIFTYQDNFRFELAEVQKINPENNTVTTTIGDVKYDYLVIATGADTNFFGNTQIAQLSMPMKNIPEALNLRSVIVQNLEKAYITNDAAEKAALLTFVVVGGGPTGVELSGALAEMAKLVLHKDYHGFKKQDMEVYLVEGKPDLLANMSPMASERSKKFLTEMGVTIHTGVHVKSYNGNQLTIDDGTTVNTRNVFWAAGVMGEMPDGIPKEIIVKGDRIQTDEINRVKGYKNIFAVGDVAAVITPETPNGHPGVAPAAIQQGQQLAKNIIRLMKGQDTVPFKYKDKGTMATIGRNKAVADIGKLHFGGFFAWLLWMFVHLLTLVGFGNKTMVFLSWALNYFSKNSDNRLIIRSYAKPALEPEAVSK